LTLACAGLLLANFPVAYGVMLFVISIVARYTVIVIVDPGNWTIG
jgi:hypothetical protein